MNQHHNYENIEIKSNKKGGKIIRKVYIKNNKGYKSITKFSKGKKISSVKKNIHPHHIKSIKNGKFVHGLFKDCKNNKTCKKH